LVQFLDDTLGIILLQTGNSAEALGALESAWDKAADRPDVGYHDSQALMAAGQGEKALSVLRRVLKERDTILPNGIKRNCCCSGSATERTHRCAG
jgi:predicted Zn-dependent protease